jgi:hypothetical protein
LEGGHNARSSEETGFQVGEFLTELSKSPACVLDGEALEGWLWRQRRKGKLEPAIRQRDDANCVGRWGALVGPRGKLLDGDTRGDEQQTQGNGQVQCQHAHK